MVRGDIPARKAFEDDEVMAFHDISPKAPVHVLFITKRHFKDASDLKDPLLFGKLCRAAAAWADQEGALGGAYRMVLNKGAGAGQSVFHIHLHVLGGRPFSWPPG